MFIDRVKIKVRAGNGGRGAVSFRREKYVPMGGPDGGDGGKGGDVIFYVEPGETTLIQLHKKPWYAATNGGNGQSSNKTGKDGRSIRLPVPPGTLVREVESGRILCDLVGEDEERVIAAGGRGGKGNSHFATSTHQVPRRAEPGKPGDEFELLVELKMVADIGLVGFPNAGKSTLLNAMTRASAKIGNYPFTTLHPVLGTLTLSVDEDQALTRIVTPEGETPTRIRPRIIVADIPGILEGAHEGVGLGLEFLKHIERTEVLLFVLDASVQRAEEPAAAYRSLIDEIRSYREDLLDRPRVIALNKIDDPLDESELPQLVRTLDEVNAEEEPRPIPGTVFPISAKEGIGITPLRDELVRLILEVRRELKPPIVHGAVQTAEGLDEEFPDDEEV